MKATQANFLRFLKRSDQLEIPIYQRTYSWTRKECQQLWSDIIRSASGGAHFIGSLVYIESGIYSVSSANAVEVIDGQQRATTLSLLLLAAARVGKNGSERIVRDYLLQDDDLELGDDERYKLLPTKGDRETYQRLI